MLATWYMIGMIKAESLSHFILILLAAIDVTFFIKYSFHYISILSVLFTGKLLIQAVAEQLGKGVVITYTKTFKNNSLNRTA